MRKRLICLFLGVLIAAASCVCARAADLELSAPSAILMEKTTGEILYEQNSHEKLAPASVTKIMTLLLVMEALEDGRISWDDTVTTSAEAAAKGGSQIYLEENEQLPLTEMLKSVVVASANDCACALAEHIAGSESAFVSMMNERAQELGMTDTHFVNCTGLDDGPDAGEHLTTAYDIALMSRELLKHERIKEYTTIWMDTVRNGQFGLANTNKLVRFFDGCDGIKTGYTSEAGHCVAATVKRDNMRLISVIIGGKTSQGRFDDARNLINYGFANYKKTELLQPGMLPDAIELKNGMTDSVRVKPDGLPSVILEKSRAGNIEARTDIPQSLNAPVKAGDRVGGIVFLLDGREIAKVNVVADQDGVQATMGEFFSKLIRHW